jgi:hypothetical protein
MLTLNHVAQKQAALIAACSRPRALAPVAGVAGSVSLWQASAAASVAAVSAGFGSVAVVRPFVEERPAGYGMRRARLAGTGTRALAGAHLSGISFTQQDKNDLTSRREPRTWRPPH